MMIATNTHIRKRIGFRFMAFNGAFKETIKLFKISICIKILSHFIFESRATWHG